MNHPKSGRFAKLLSVSFLMGTTLVQAQLQTPLEVRAGSPIRDAAGQVLSGSNPNANAFGLPLVPGCVVQIIDAGPDGQAGWPAAGGGVSGDDVLMYTATIGQGIVPTDTGSGRLDASFTPPPALGTRMYARAFNAATAASATHWGQSAVFQIQSLVTIDLSAFGLIATTIPVGADPFASDSDGDGVTDAMELAANTNASDAGDRPLIHIVPPAGPTGGAGGNLAGDEAAGTLAAAAARDAVIQINGKAGRRYLLQRSGDLANPAAWTEISDTGILSENQLLQLLDTPPDPTSAWMYRVQILQP